MKTSKEIEEAFRKDITELFAKHKADFRVTDDGKPYGQHTGIVEVTITSQYNEDGEQLSEFTEFNL